LPDLGLLLDLVRKTGLLKRIQFSDSGNFFLLSPPNLHTVANQQGAQ